MLPSLSSLTSPKPPNSPQSLTLIPPNPPPSLPLTSDNHAGDNLQRKFTNSIVPLRAVKVIVAIVAPLNTNKKCVFVSSPSKESSTIDPHLQNVRTNCFIIKPSSGGSYPTVPNESLALEGAQHQHYHPANVRGISKKASGEASVAGAGELDDDDIDVANPQGGSGDDGMMPGLVDSFP